MNERQLATLIIIAAVAIVCAIAACLMVHEMREASARGDCRASGRRVVTDRARDEWWCAPLDRTQGIPDDR